MDQNYLNSVNISDWDYKGIYNEIFQDKMTAKHALTVGKWEKDKFWGIDLRRFSYNESRLLGSGITIFSDTWVKLFKLIIHLHNDNFFSHYPNFDKVLTKTIEIDKNYSLGTALFEGGGKTFYCINMLENGKMIFKGRNTSLSIMIRFDIIPNFISQCQSNNLVQIEENLHKNIIIDKKSKKEIF